MSRYRTTKKLRAKKLFEILAKCYLLSKKIFILCLIKISCIFRDLIVEILANNVAALSHFFLLGHKAINPEISEFSIFPLLCKMMVLDKNINL